MVRDIASLLMVTVAAGLPFAVQARLEAVPMPRTGETAASALVAPRELAEHLSTPAQPGRVQRSADGMFYVTARVNGHPVRFLVDTGASIIILSSQDARGAGLAEDSTVYGDRVNTVAGRANAARTAINELEVAGRQINGLEAAIVEEGVGVSLLGHNALARFDSLSIQGDELVLR